MPRPKLIHHGMGDDGYPMLAPPTDDYRTCPHPRMALRFDPRYGVPCAMYCRACGLGGIHPFHGCTPEQIENARRKGAELYEALRENNPHLDEAA